MPAFPAVAVCDVDAAADDPTATSGNCCLKLARRSSPGFCELVLEDGEKIHVSLWPIFQGTVPHSIRKLELREPRAMPSMHMP